MTQGRGFASILVANRGEIAVRVMATARRLGLETVAVHSDADAGALHVRMADRAVRIGPAPAVASYLDIDAVLAAARASGAEAIHPGYGFLSENAGFAEAVEAAGLVWIGPPPAAIRAMGLKDAAKRLMEKAGVPVVPGYHGEAQELVVLAGKASEIGYPVLIKARAGGGGKGMRLVERAEEFRDALAGARREAKAAFGDERVLVEKYIEAPRHIEVQVFGDAHGNVVHLYERDCSMQRRHQKVIEEAPAPGMTAEVRAAMCGAAVRAAAAIGYQGAGTIEFIVDGAGGLRPDGFWFMEMNTRLQVEHPVTEMVTGLDLVEWQIRVARGEPLPLAQDAIRLSGHAMEARLYAEDPARGFLPATGTLHHLRLPGPPARTDTGVAAGDAISPWYDPMIAKVIAHGEDREAARTGLLDALAATEIAGCTTNLAFLSALVADEDFAAARLDTGLIGRKGEALTEVPEPDPALESVAALAVLGLERPAPAGDLFAAVGPFALWDRPVHHADLAGADGARRTLAVSSAGGGRWRVATPEGRARVLSPDLREDGSLAVAGIGRGPLSLARWPGHVAVVDGPVSAVFALYDPAGGAAEHGGGDAVTAPMPGLVKLVSAHAGGKVAKGAPLLVLEAMKMEHTLTAPRDGTVAEIRVSQGDQVSAGDLLVRLEAEA